MANPSWSIDNIIFNDLPAFYLFGGKPRSSEQSVIDLETDYGARFVYELANRKVYTLKFIIKETDLPQWEDLQASVRGPAVPFYFSISGAGAGDAVYVRKETGFDPEEMKSPGGSNPDYTEPLYEYTMQLKAEVA